MPPNYMPHSIGLSQRISQSIANNDKTCALSLKSRYSEQIPITKTYANSIFYLPAVPLWLWRSLDGKSTPVIARRSELRLFKAIYVDRDVEQAKQFVDEPIKQVLTHYYIAAAVQRNMLGLSMTNVEMEIDDIDIDFFRKFTKDVIVVIKMKGLKGGQPWIDDRTIRLHKIGSKWTIVELMPEKRKVNG
ncbi:hypothetical protein LFREDSHE_30840 [Shewanella baltica]